MFHSHSFVFFNNFFFPFSHFFSEWIWQTPSEDRHTFEFVLASAFTRNLFQICFRVEHAMTYLSPQWTSNSLFLLFQERLFSYLLPRASIHGGPMESARSVIQHRAWHPEYNVIFDPLRFPHFQLQRTTVHSLSRTEIFQSKNSTSCTVCHAGCILFSIHFPSKGVIFA